MAEKEFNIIAIGEVLWDIFPDGKTLGGAPLNFAYHAGKSGVFSTIISAIGNDNLGKEICSILETKSQNYLFSKSQLATGTVFVDLNKGIPSYKITESVAWDDINLNLEEKQALKEANAICWGTLAQRSRKSREAIFQAVKLLPEQALKIFDINLRPPFYNIEIIVDSLKLANVLKLNIEELEILMEMFNFSENKDEACAQLMMQFQLKYLALTNGSEGSTMYSEKEMSYIKAEKVEIVDTVGAGDSFTAVMTCGILFNKSLKDIHAEASKYAARICMQKGSFSGI